MDKEFRRELILENYQHPFHKMSINDEDYIKVNSNNESCIDNLDFYLKIKNNIIEDAFFDGEACAISTSATSMMLKKIVGKSILEVKELLNNYEKMILEEKYNKDLLKDLNAYDEIYLQPNRKTCALLPLKGIIKALEEYSNGN